MKDAREWCFWMMTLSSFLLLALAVFLAVQRENLKSEAVHLGYAEYNSTNGVWQWKEPKK